MLKVSVDTSSEMTASGWYIPFQNLLLIYVFVCAHRVMTGPLNGGVSPLCQGFPAPVLTAPQVPRHQGHLCGRAQGQTARVRLPPSNGSPHQHTVHGARGPGAGRSDRGSCSEHRVEPSNRNRQRPRVGVPRGRAVAEIPDHETPPHVDGDGTTKDRQSCGGEDWRDGTRCLAAGHAAGRVLRKRKVEPPWDPAPPAPRECTQRKNSPATTKHTAEKRRLLMFQTLT